MRPAPRRGDSSTPPLCRAVKPQSGPFIYKTANGRLAPRTAILFSGCSSLFLGPSKYNAMNNTNGKLIMSIMADLSDGTLITILVTVLAISCTLALLLMIPTTIQYVGALIKIKRAAMHSALQEDSQTLYAQHYERDLYRYRIMFNLSVLLIVVGSSVALLIHLANVSHQNKGHSKVDETRYEFVISIWGICHLLMLLDVGSRVFFACMVTTPTVIICLFLLLRKPRPDIIFRLILVFSFVSLVFAFVSPAYLISNLWKKRRGDNDDYMHCVLHKRNVFYVQMQMFELLLCHLLPVLIIVPSILYTSIKTRVAALDVFYEPVIFVVANLPFVIIEIVEQVSISRNYDFSSGRRFANFYMTVVIIYHLSYTCMFLVAPIRSMFSEGDEDSGEVVEANHVYQVLIAKASVKKSIRRQFSPVMN